MSRYNDPPYEHRITCSTDHLRGVNSNSLHNFLVTPNLPTTRMSHCLLHSSSLNDFKIRLQLRISCTQSYHAPTFNTSFPLLSHPFTLSACDGRENLPTPEMRQGNLEPATFSLSLDSTRNTKMLYCANPTSTLLGAKQARTK